MCIKTTTTPQHLRVNEAEAEVVREIYRWCVEEQLSSYAIHRRLTLQGVPPRKSKHSRWAQRECHRALRDSLSIKGKPTTIAPRRDVRRPYGRAWLKDRHPGNGQSRTRRPQSEWIPVRVPALIDPETWDRAQGQLARNRGARSATIRSIRICCGVWWSVGAVAGAWWARGVPRAAAIFAPCASSVCAGGMHGPQPQCDLLEACVWEHVKALLSDPTVLRTQYEQGRGDPAVDVRAEQERGRLERKLATLDREVTRLIDAYQAEGLT